MAIPFWVANLNRDPRRLEAMERRWSSVLTQAQLANPWQAVAVDGRALPGLWLYKKVKRKLKAQANKKAGADGGSATIRGLVNPDFQLIGQLFIPSHFSDWIEVVQDLDVTGKPSAREQHLIEHPMASLAGIRNMIVLGFEYDLPMQGGPLGVTLDCLGVSARDGATKTPAAPPPTSPPAIKLPSSGDARPITPFVVKPPGAAR